MLKNIFISLIFFFSFIVSTSSVYAYQGPFTINEEVFLFANCVEETSNGSFFVDTTQSLDIVYSNGSFFKENLSMFSYDTGKFYTNVTFNESGNYVLIKKCNKVSDGSEAVGADTAKVIDINEELDKLSYFTILVILLIGFIFIYLGYKFENAILLSAAAIWYLGTAGVIGDLLFGSFINVGTAFMAALGLYFIFESYTSIIDAKAKQKEDNY